MTSDPKALLLAGLACLLPATAGAACDPSRFFASVKKPCIRSEGSCMAAYLPQEIKDIARGAVVESVGLSVNDGRASWRALDLDRREVVVVERYAGRKLGQAPKLATSTAHEYLKNVGEGQASIVDHVRRYPLAPATYTSLGCLASADWSQPFPPVQNRTDTAGRAYLMLGDKAESLSTLGVFEGAPGDFVKEIDAIVKRQKPGAAPR